MKEGSKFKRCYRSEIFQVIFFVYNNIKGGINKCIYLDVRDDEVFKIVKLKKIKIQINLNFLQKNFMNYS